MDDETSETSADEVTADAGQSAEKPFAELTDAEKVEFLLGKTRRLEDQVKGKSRDPDVRALKARIKELEPYQEQMRALEEASRTEAERATIKAREDGEKVGREAAAAAAVERFAPLLVGAEFRANLAGRMTAEQVDTLVWKLNVSAFLDDAGAVDKTAVAEYVAAIPAPAATQTAPLPLRPGSFGGGRRESPQSTGVARGRELYADRHPKKTTPA